MRLGSKSHHFLYCTRHMALVALLALLWVLPASADTPAVLKFGIVSPAKPSRIYADWALFAAYLSKQMHMPVEIVIPKGMGQVQAFAENGDMDVFYINAYTFYRLQEAKVAEPLVQMRNLRGNIMSHGTFLVRADSPVQKIEELRGKTIALISPLGAGSYLAPRAFLNKHGLKIEQDVKVIYTQDLLRAAYMVMLSEVDAVVMCAVSYDIVDSKVELGEMRHIAETDDFAEPIIAMRTGFDAHLAERLREVLLHMAETPDGKRALAPLEDMKVSSFIPYDPAAEEMTRVLIEEGGF